jgi:hypothetical protein
MGDADSPYLSTFASRGKMIVYSGLSDQGMAIPVIADWYERMIAATGDRGRDAVRLFAVPGMLHCGGGEATDQFEMLDAIMDWVEEGKAPDRIVATSKAFPAFRDRFVPIHRQPSTWAVTPLRRQLLVPGKVVSEQVRLPSGSSFDRAKTANMSLRRPIHKQRMFALLAMASEPAAPAFSGTGRSPCRAAFRPISFRPSPHCQRSQISALSAAVNRTPHLPIECNRGSRAQRRSP